MPDPLKIDKVAVRSAIEAGASYEQTSKIFKVPMPTLRQWAKRGGWITATVIQTLAVSGENPVTPVSQAETKAMVAEAIAESWADKGEAHRRLIFEKTHAALKGAKLDAPKNWKDAEIADKMARKAAGLESGDTQVNVALLPGAWGAQMGQIREIGDSSESTMEMETIEPPALATQDQSEGGE